MSKFQIGAPVAIETSPVTATSAQRRGMYAEVYEKLLDLKRGTALPLAFKHAKDSSYALTQLRKLAKRDSEFLSSSATPDKLTRWFWVEPKSSLEDLPTVLAKTERAA